METITISWSVEDLQSLRPDMTAEEARELLNLIRKPLIDRSIEEGWHILRDLLSMYEYNKKIGVV